MKSGDWTIDHPEIDKDDDSHSEDSNHMGECIECGKVILSWEEVYCDQCWRDLEAEGFFDLIG